MKIRTARIRILFLIQVLILSGYCRVSAAAYLPPLTYYSAATQPVMQRLSGNIPPADETQRVFNEVVVTYSQPPHQNARERIALVQESERLTDEIERIAASDEMSLAAAVECLKQDENVLAIEPNYLFFATDTTATSAESASSTGGQQWYLDNVRFTEARAQYPDRGNTVTVAVIDSGIASSHEALDKSMMDLENAYNFISDAPGAEDDNGHGTAVCGLLLGNGKVDGFTGALSGYGAKVLPIKALDSSASGPLSAIVSAVSYATEKGADIINMSLSTTQHSVALESAVSQATDAGALVIASTGNEGRAQVNYPAALPHVLAVGATAWGNSLGGDYIASFSTYGDYTDLCAPGQNIFTTSRSGFSTMDGTSYAAPLVSAAAAMLLLHNPDLTPRELQYLLKSSADRLFVPSPPPYCGTGRLDVLAALQKTAQPLPALSEALNIPPQITLSAGQSAWLPVSVLPTGAQEGVIRYRSTHPAVADVDAAGCVRGVSPGQTTVTVVSYDSGALQQCEVTVTEGEVAPDRGISPDLTIFGKSVMTSEGMAAGPVAGGQSVTAHARIYSNTYAASGAYRVCFVAVVTDAETHTVQAVQTQRIILPPQSLYDYSASFDLPDTNRLSDVQIFIFNQNLRSLTPLSRTL